LLSNEQVLEQVSSYEEHTSESAGERTRPFGEVPFK
jgi:hypothetical protein